MNIDIWKKRRKELKVTYDQLAEMSGVSRRTIAGIFSGDEHYQSPTFNTVQAIERALGLSSDPPPNKTAEPLTEAEERLLGAYRQLVPSMQDYVLEMVEKLIVSQPAAADAAKRA